MTAVLQDLRYGARMLRRHPGTTAAAVISLALGIGANAAIYSWVRGILLDPLPGVADQHEVVCVAGRSKGGAWHSLSYLDYVDFRDSTRAFQGLAAYTFMTASVGASREGQHAERIYGSLVSGDFFDVLRVRMTLGRGFSRAEDEAPGRARVVVISHSLWQRRFDADRSIVGRTILLNNKPYTVVGVTAPGFYGAWSGLSMDIWVPMMMQADVMPGLRLQERGSRWLQALGRLAPGVAVEEANAEARLIAERLARAWPRTNDGQSAAAVPMWRSPFGAQQILTPVLLTLSVVVGLVLLLACANVANLLLARALGRRREMAIRLAIGAARARLARQMLTESVLLAGAGGAGGVLVALGLGPLFGKFLPPTDMPVRPLVGVDAAVLAFTATLSLATGILFGLAPAFQSSRADLAGALREESSVGSRQRSRLRNALVIAQVALSMLLLVGAGLFVRSLRVSQRVDPGFNPHGLLVASYNLFPNGYTPETGRIFHERLVRRLQAEPGVRAVGLAARLPLGFEGSSSMTVSIDGYVPRADEDLTILINATAPGYFTAMEIPIIAGRDFTFDDRADTTPVMIINRTMAQRYWKGDPIGRLVRIGDTAHQVVGVVPTGKYQTLAEDPAPYMYLAILQFYRPNGVVHVRMAGGEGSALALLRSAVASLDPNVPLFEIRTGDQHMGFATFANRLAASFLGAFGALALLLAGVGLYGVMAFAVAQRTREIGIRVALGARSVDILRSIVAQGLRVAAVGSAIGAAGALAAAPLASRLLLGVSPSDAATYAIVAVLLTLVAVVASGIPARRAARLDPVTALRHP
jgi:predicted permease